MRNPRRQKDLLDRFQPPGRVFRNLLGALKLGVCALLSTSCRCESLPHAETGPRTEIPTYRAQRAEGPITIDGEIDSESWSEAPWTEYFVGTMHGQPAGPATRAKLLWDDNNLYVAFDVQDEFLRADLSGHDPHLWTQDTVEIMVDPDGDGRNYFEMQLAPSEQVFDTRYDTRRVPGPIGHANWDSQLRGGIRLRGQLNDDQADQGYSAEMAIPWTAFRAGNPPAQPPSTGDRWRVALYLLDEVQNGHRAVGWSPPLVGDFHVPDRFGWVEFVQQ